MNSTEVNIVRIESSEGLATGFIHNPSNDFDFVYIITARHCFVDKNNIAVLKSDIRVSFFDPENSSYQLSETDGLFYGIDNIGDDVSVIVVSKTSIPAAIDITAVDSLATITGKEKKCSIKGVPKFVNNELKRTIYAAEFLYDKDYEDQIQIGISDPVTDFYNADDLIEGYSGSPVIIESDGDFFPCGIFLAYENYSKRGLAINLSPIKKLLANAELPQINLIEVETNIDVLADIKKIRKNTNRVINRIKDRIGEIKLSRSEEIEKLKTNILAHSFVLISGRAGIGKSAFAKRVIEELSTDYEIIGLQGEQLDKPGIKEIFSESPFALAGNIDDIFISSGMKSKKIILIDSLEKLLETSNADTVIDFFNLLNLRTDITLILTCRSYAVEQLKIRFLQQFPAIVPFNVPLLSDEELKEIYEKYQHIEGLIKRPSLKRLLQIPFNMDKAIYIQTDVLAGEIDSESGFKKIMWEYVVENKQRENDPVIRKERGRLFSEIALTRARSMVPYVTVVNNETVLAQLLHDNIVEVEPILNDGYAPSHDIYEDWALTRFIESKFQDFNSTGLTIIFFFHQIGYAPAIRRAFRIWISEKLQNIDYNTEQLIQNTIEGETLERYWKDEMIIAVMQSAYSKVFLSRNRSILFSNEFNLFKRCILLLQVACQSPNFSYLNHLKDNEKSQIYHSAYLKPFGDGWPYMINFICDYLGDLERQFQLIIPFLIQWQKCLDPFGALPTESRNVGLILLRYFEAYRNDNKQYKITEKNQIKNSIALLFKLSAVLQKEVKDLIEQAMNAKDFEDDWRIKDFWEQIISNTLSWTQSMEISILYPDLVIKMAEKEWFYHEPTPEGQSKILEASPFKSLPREIEKDEKFGVVNEFKRNYYPAGVYQTPISHLLNSSYQKAIPFIVKLFNHSAEAFEKSDFLKNEIAGFRSDERSTVEIVLSDGSIIRQSGSLALWTMYRGTFIATPYLLQSVLMALENWLLLLARVACKDVDNKYPQIKQQLNYAFDYLIRESKSVATTSVLIGVATAYPKILADNILPLLKVKEFYSWDLSRLHHETQSLAPIGSSPEGEWQQRERFASNQLEHRKKHMENLVIELSFGDYRERIFEILDEFYKENSEEIGWKFALNRMDVRKMEIIGEVENGFLIQSKIDEDLKPKAEESKLYIDEISPLSEASNWGRKKLENNQVDNGSYEEWKRHYTNVAFTKSDDQRIKLFNNPALIAAVGVRDFFEELNQNELEWCVNKVFGIVEYELKRSHNPYDIGLDSPFGAFESEPAFIALTHLVYKCQGDYQLKSKELLISSLLLIHNEIEREEITKNFKNILWDEVPDFALSCIRAMIDYSRLSELHVRIAHFQPSGPKNKPADINRRSKTSFFSKGLDFIKYRLFSKKKKNNSSPDDDINKQWEKLVEEYNGKLKYIISKALEESGSLDFKNFESTNQSAYYLIEALLLIPETTKNENLHSFCTKIMEFIMVNLEAEGRFNDEKIPYNLQQDFEKYFALFLLKQSPDISLSKFKALLDPMYENVYPVNYNGDKAVKLVQSCLENMITYVRGDDSLAINFWMLWKYLSEKEVNSATCYFSEILLLDYPYWNNEAKDWEPLRGKKDFLKSLFLKDGIQKSGLKLLSGIGFTELMPDGILWISNALNDKPFNDKYEVFYGEKLIISIFYDKKIRVIIRNNKALRDSFIKILDKLIDHNSSSAFLIRDDFISLN